MNGLARQIIKQRDPLTNNCVFLWALHTLVVLLTLLAMKCGPNVPGQIEKSQRNVLVRSTIPKAEKARHDLRGPKASVVPFGKSHLVSAAGIKVTTGVPAEYWM